MASSCSMAPLRCPVGPSAPWGVDVAHLQDLCERLAGELGLTGSARSGSGRSATWVSWGNS